MSKELHAGNLALITRIQSEAAAEVKAITDLNTLGELLVGDGAKASHLDPATGTDSNVLILDSAAPLGVKWGAVPSSFDQDLNTTDNVTFNNLTVNGTTTTINSVSVTIDDSLQKWANNNAADAIDSGWYASYNDGVPRFCGMHRVRGTNTFKFYTGLTVDPASGIDNQVNDTDPSFQYAEVEVAQLNLIAANGNFTNIIPAATTTTWSMVLPNDKPLIADKSLVSSTASGETTWADRVSQLTMGAGMDQTAASVTTTGTLLTDDTTLPAHPTPVLPADVLGVNNAATQVKTTVAALAPAIDHDQLLNHDVNQHVDHTGVSLLVPGPHLEITGDATISNNITLTHSDTIVTPATYTFATVTVDQRGHLTSASSGTPVTSVDYPALSGMTLQTITTTGAAQIDMTNAQANMNPSQTNIMLTETAGGVLEKTTVANLNSNVLLHDNLTDYVANEHIDHSSVSLTAAANSGLTVDGTTAGNLTASRALALDANNLQVHAGPLAVASDKFVLYDTTNLTTSTLTKANMELSLNHNNLVNGGGNQHIDHSTVTVIGSNSGLAVTNNNITASMGIVQDINTLLAIGANVHPTQDLLAVYDGSAGSNTTRKATIGEFEVAVNHNNLLNYVSNQHIDHSSVSLTAAVLDGLDVGGTTSANITASRALRFRPGGLATITGAGLNKVGDSLVFHDLSSTGASKVTMAEFESVLSHDALADFVANEHIDHTTVSMNTVATTSGLTGGGSIAASRNLTVDIVGTSGLGGSPAVDDILLVQQNIGGALQKVTTLELNGSMALLALADYSANDHLDHSLVLMQAIADSGLTVDADNATHALTESTRQLAVQMPVTTLASPDLLADVVMVKDANGAGSGLRSMLIQDLMGAQLNLGAASTGVTVASTDNMGSAFHKVTRLNLTAFTIAVAGAASEGVGKSMYTFPLSGSSGVTIHSVVMNVALTGTGVVNTDTPEVGVGSTVASGVVSVLSGTPTFENVLTGTVVTDVAGTSTYTMGAPNLADVNVPVGPGMSIFLNLADAWAGADTVTCTGTVTVNWSFIP